MDQLGNKSNSGPKFESAVVSALGEFNNDNNDWHVTFSSFC
jgi:hypothetical protein